MAFLEIRRRYFKNGYRVFQREAKTQNALSQLKDEGRASEIASLQRQCCANCRFFLDDPIDFEKALPGICILSSGQGDTKGDQGICMIHQQMAVSRMCCKQYKP